MRCDYDKPCDVRVSILSTKPKWLVKWWMDASLLYCRGRLENGGPSNPADKIWQVVSSIYRWCTSEPWWIDIAKCNKLPGVSFSVFPVRSGDRSRMNPYSGGRTSPDRRNILTTFWAMIGELPVTWNTLACWCSSTAKHQRLWPFFAAVYWEFSSSGSMCGTCSSCAWFSWIGYAYLSKMKSWSHSASMDLHPSWNARRRYWFCGRQDIAPDCGACMKLDAFCWSRKTRKESGGVFAFCQCKCVCFGCCATFR